MAIKTFRSVVMRKRIHSHIEHSPSSPMQFFLLRLACFENKLVELCTCVSLLFITSKRVMKANRKTVELLDK